MAKYQWEPVEVPITAPLELPHQLSLFKPFEWGGNDDPDLGTCPYYQRYHGFDGADPAAVCYQMSVCEGAGEPLCVTDEPKHGWRSQKQVRFDRMYRGVSKGQFPITYRP